MVFRVNFDGHRWCNFHPCSKPNPFKLLLFPLSYFPPLLNAMGRKCRLSMNEMKMITGNDIFVCVEEDDENLHYVLCHYAPFRDSCNCNCNCNCNNHLMQAHTIVLDTFSEYYFPFGFFFSLYMNFILFLILL